METEIATEKQLTVEIERLREQFPQTQDLYREVCALLFFRYGTTPTANKLYQLVRKGSMSAPAEALSKFWSDLREKSRTRIEHPDLPEALKAATGELAVAVWTAAQQHAAEHVAGYRHEADLAVTEAKNALSAAIAERDLAKSALEQSRQSIADQQKRISELEQALATAKGSTESLEKQLSHALMENATTQDRLENARREFGEQLERLREAAVQAEERFQAMEKRSLLEIDRERQTAARLQKETEGARAELARASERHRHDMEGLQTQIGNLRQQLGALEGKLHETSESKKELADQVRELSTKSQELAAHAVTLQSELQNWRTRAEKAESRLHEESRNKSVKRTPKTAKPS